MAAGTCPWLILTSCCQAKGISPSQGQSRAHGPELQACPVASLASADPGSSLAPVDRGSRPILEPDHPLCPRFQAQPGAPGTPRWGQTLGTYQHQAGPSRLRPKAHSSARPAPVNPGVCLVLLNPANRHTHQLTPGQASFPKDPCHKPSCGPQHRFTLGL